VNRGTRIPVDVPTYVTATLEFESGVLGSLLTTFDVWASNLPRIEIYGTKGTLALPDPDGYTGRPRLKQAGWPDWREVPLPAYKGERAIGLSDMAHGLRTGEPHRADGELAYHVLDVSLAILDSSAGGEFAEVSSTCRRPAPVPPTGVPGGSGAQS
jgi:predicted dehydrogenase